jgi:hypothetical protein
MLKGFAPTKQFQTQDELQLDAKIRAKAYFVLTGSDRYLASDLFPAPDWHELSKINSDNDTYKCQLQKNKTDYLKEGRPEKATMSQSELDRLEKRETARVAHLNGLEQKKRIMDTFLSYAENAGTALKQTQSTDLTSKEKEHQKAFEEMRRKYNLDGLQSTYYSAFAFHYS